MNASISVSSSVAGFGVDPHRVAGQEQVGRVVVELGALVGAEGVLDGELVQAELAGELVELRLRRAAEVDPHHRVGLLQVVGDVGDGKPSASRTPSRYTLVMASPIAVLHARPCSASTNGLTMV